MMETHVRDLELILDAIDEDLLVHVDEQGHLAVGAAERLLDYTRRLVKGDVVFQDVHSEWPDWYPLVGAFVEVYESDDMAEMFDLAPLGEPDARPTTYADEAFLQQLIEELSLYVSHRRAGDTDF